jgi:hypothetical protein
MQIWLRNGSFENMGRSGLESLQAELLDSVIPAWSAEIQIDMDVFGGIPAHLDAGHPCRHDEDLHFHNL